VHACARACMRACIYACLCVCVCVLVRVCVENWHYIGWTGLMGGQTESWQTTPPATPAYHFWLCFSCCTCSLLHAICNNVTQLGSCQNFLWNGCLWWPGWLMRIRLSPVPSLDSACEPSPRAHQCSQSPTSILVLCC